MAVIPGSQSSILKNNPGFVPHILVLTLPSLTRQRLVAVNYGHLSMIFENKIDDVGPSCAECTSDDTGLVPSTQISIVNSLKGG